MENSDESSALLQIHPSDNIAVLRRSMPEGARYEVSGKCFRLVRALPLGHKLALRPIRSGEKIVKYGVSIGSATADVSAGDHVHVHNMKSDYLPTYTLEEGGKYGAH